MTPIGKNVVVVDEQGKEYEATYPKRAKGLVKNGRARFVDNNKICLACPPNKNLEDIIMEDSNIKIADENILTEKPLELTMEYILIRIDKIMNDTEHLNDALKVIPTILNSQAPGDSTGEQKAKAIASIVTARETTNQHLLKLLEKMYDDLKPIKAAETEKDSDIKKFIALNGVLKGLKSSDYIPEALDIIKKSAQQMFVKEGNAVVR